MDTRTLIIFYFILECSVNKLSQSHIPSSHKQNIKYAILFFYNIPLCCFLKYGNNVHGRYINIYVQICMYMVSVSLLFLCLLISFPVLFIYYYNHASSGNNSNNSSNSRRWKMVIITIIAIYLVCF